MRLLSWLGCRLWRWRLAELSRDDRRLIEEYYDITGKGQGRSPSDLAKKLGITVRALQLRVIGIRRRPAAKIRTDEEPGQARFTAYYPQSVIPQSWNTVLAYMHVPNALAVVQADSKRRFGEIGAETDKKTATRKVRIARGTQIVVVPQSGVLEFNPSQVAFAWLEDYHCAEFRCRVRTGVSEDSNWKHAAVTFAFFVAPILIAEISFTIIVGSTTEPSDHTRSATVHPYQRVFVSYSHHDSKIADQLEKAYQALGIEYLRDVRMLRSGEK